MKKIFSTLLLALMSVMGAWAQQASIENAKDAAIADINAAVDDSRTYLLAVADGYIAQINDATTTGKVAELRTKALAELEAMKTEPTAFRMLFKGENNPIETEHLMDGVRITFDNDGEDMLMTVNGKTVIYPVSNVSEMELFNGTPTVQLHANEDPDNKGDYYTTFYSGLEAYTIPNGVRAYTAEISDNNIVLTSIEGNVLPQGEAVLLFSNTLNNGDWTMEIADASSVSKSYDNQFDGVDITTEQDGNNYYMLSYGQNNLGFYKMNTSKALSANKAFITRSSAAQANVRALGMVFSDEFGGITNVIATPVRNAEDDAIYSVSGIRQNELQNGINIVNGKKIAVK